MGGRRGLTDGFVDKREKDEKRERGGAGKRERVGLERTKSLA